VQYPTGAMWLWKVGWVLMWLLHPLVFKLRVEGAENVPMTGGCVVACNHTMGPDFLILGTASPRQIHFMAKIEAFAIHPIVSWILHHTGVFPVHRGKSDSGALDRAVQLVIQGHAVGMFPEGTRSRTGSLNRGKSGVARIALRANAPVLPVAVINAPAVFDKLKFRRFSRPTVVVRFGVPVQWHEQEDEAHGAKHFTNQIMHSIAALLPPELQGFYAKGIPGEPVDVQSRDDASESEELTT
jgi:1-acyl-sn-glycerol-3-phosphate acyltransferase